MGRPSWYNEPKNHPAQVARRRRQNAALFGDVVDTTDLVDTRVTPQALFDQLDAEFHFTVDAAASADNAKCERFYTREQDGLIQPWVEEVIWCNPPYSEIPAWVAKAALAAHRLFSTVVMLLPANRTEQPWWQTFVEPWRDRGEGVETRFLAGRQKFAGSGSGGSAPLRKRPRHLASRGP